MKVVYGVELGFKGFWGLLFFERYELILGGEFLDRTRSVPIA
jgi:hypothetical protein